MQKTISQEKVSSTMEGNDTDERKQQTGKVSI